ncbi:thermonuclease family protein [Nocardia sp. NPDC056100]|uniref:thermonuclease family protein n=1 Tax=Nocardia sp. NPDC056100 TaxID=3345712 RepID=UPI0035DFB233
MTFKVITGQFRVIGAQPDGDSIRFYPHDSAALARTGLAVRPNAQGGFQLRLDGIDALETHYRPPHAAHNWHQPPELADKASAELLAFLGFTDVTRKEQTVTAATPATIDGYILTKFADKYGRAVAFAFPGEPDTGAHDGGAHFVDPDELTRSANHQLLEQGLAYPTYYSGLFPDLRQVLTAAVETARGKASGIWAQDVTTVGFDVTSIDDLESRVVILPKLFRRLAEYLAADTSAVDMSHFDQFLAAHGDELYTLDTGHSTHLDTLVEVRGSRVRLTVAPEDIIFREK